MLLVPQQAHRHTAIANWSGTRMPASHSIMQTGRPACGCVSDTKVRECSYRRVVQSWA